MIKKFSKNKGRIVDRSTSLDTKVSNTSTVLIDN